MSEFKTPELIQFTKKDKLPSPGGVLTPGCSGEIDSVAQSTEDPVTEKTESSENGQTGDSQDTVVFTPPAAPVKREASPASKPEQQQRLPKPEDLILQKQKYEKILATLKYREPLGAAPADSRYNLEVLKSGAIVDHVNFKEKRFFVIGRIPGCDIVAENPTVSRLHAVLQFIDGGYNKDVEKSGQVDSNEDVDGEEKETQVREKGLYLYDLASTHGTFINKNRVFPNRYYRLRVGHVIKFGNSARLYVVGGPDDDEEEESEKTVTELLQERLHKELERKKLAQKMEEEGSGPPERNVEEEGISWGMGEDAEEETDLRENPFSMDFESKELNLDNPKKSLRSWFEREGYELEYDVREKAVGHYICRVDLPIDGPGTNKVFAEVEVKGKKKEAVAQCALQACQILDQYGVLRQSNRESRVKRKHRDWEEQDYYSSDEDTFLDRTGTVEKKREKRMMEAGKIQQQVETYDSLLEKDKAFQVEIDALKLKIEKAERKMQEENDEVDPLDAFMSDLKSGSPDLRKLKAKVRELSADQLKNKKLLDIAKPAIPHPSSKPISTSATPVSTSSEVQVDTTSKSTELPTKMETDENVSSDASQLPPRKSDVPLFGPRIQFKVASKPKLEPLAPLRKAKAVSESTSSVSVIANKAEEEKEEESEDDDAHLSDEDSLSSSNKDASKNPRKSEIDSNNKVSNAVPETTNDADNIDDNDEDVEDVVDPESKKLKSKKSRNRGNKANKKKDVKYDYDAEDPHYSVWVPPVGQKGDGKTSLNEKLGY